jgi:hypothetical protein
MRQGGGGGGFAGDGVGADGRGMPSMLGRAMCLLEGRAAVRVRGGADLQLLVAS